MTFIATDDKITRVIIVISKLIRVIPCSLLRLETNWVKSAYANIGESITQGDVIVTTLDGYMFQVYYDAVSYLSFI